MAVLGRNSRLLLDWYLVSSDTLTIDFELTRDQEDVPTHETPTDFIPKLATGTLTINGYISVQPNQFILEKRLQAVFDDPTGTHYFALIPDSSATGWNPVYTGQIKGNDVQVQSAAKGIITINGTAKVTSYFRPRLGEWYDGFRACLLYYNEALAVTETPTLGSYVDLGSTWDKAVFVIVTFDQAGSADILFNFIEATDGNGAGAADVFAAALEHDSGDAITVNNAEAVTKQFVKFSVTSQSGTDTVGVAAWVMGVST